MTTGVRLVGGLWSVAATLASPALRIMLARRVARGKEVAGRLGERSGIETKLRPPGRLLWLHAASVGESVSALPLVAALPPDITVLFTTGTRTSATLLAARLPELGLQHRVLHRFVPLDVPAWAARFLDHWRPDAACFMESELWPNLLAGCRVRGIPTALVNARLSARSAAAWARLPGFARHLLGGFAFVAAQSEADARRLRALGAGGALSWGNLKAAAPPLPADPAELARLSALLGGRPRWLAASTHPADEAVAVAVHRRLAVDFPGLLTAIVPRHPERGPALAQALGAPCRSAGEDPPDRGIWVADTLGELGLFYRCFGVVLVGKGFPPGGGQNPWEPAGLGCAVASGPDVSNFADAAASLAGAGALRIVTGADDLAGWLGTMLSDPDAASAMGHRALATARSDDLAQRLATRLAALVEARSPATAGGAG